MVRYYCCVCVYTLYNVYTSVKFVGVVFSVKSLFVNRLLRTLVCI